MAAVYHDRIRIVITGKGGVGKTTLTALLARCFAQQGCHVLAVDGDPQQNLAATLGLPPDQAITPLADRKNYIEEKIGAGPGRGGLMVLNPDTADVVDRFGIPAGENIRLLVMGGVRNAGTGCLCPEYTLLAAVLRNAGVLPDDVVLLDTPAGLEHFGRAVAQGFTLALIVSDGSFNALSVAKELRRLARECGIRDVILAVNRVEQGTDRQELREKIGNEFPAIRFIPADPCVGRHEPSVGPVIDEGCPVVEAVQGLVRDILARR
ncbi:MAG: AAA family ATPase [Methanomicrobiales archaeon]|nr:AAA family ATPase [Methanomicrobiales archaeon]